MERYWQTYLYKVQEDIIDAILDGSTDKAPTKVIPYFDFVVPTELPGVDPNILDPRDTYADAAQWDEKAKDLAGRFIKNFAKFTGNEAVRSWLLLVRNCNNIHNDSIKAQDFGSALFLYIYINFIINVRMF